MLLIDNQTLLSMERMRSAGQIPTPDQQQEYESRYYSTETGTESRIMTVVGDVAQINVAGLLSPKPDFWSWWLGYSNTTYPDIEQALSMADADRSVKTIDMHIDSPGGYTAGLFDAIAAMQSTSKPIRAIVGNLAASAAYGLASQAGEIIATSPAAQFGSVGVVVDYYTDEHVVSITSSEAPKKRPDVTTDEGVQMVRDELDALHDLFAESIATGRGTTVAKVNENFGNGGILLAAEAERRGMIDRLESNLNESQSQTAAVAASGKPERANMDLETLKAEHPGVYAAAVKDGVDQERDRVGAHIEMGTQSGAMDVAVKAITDGEGMTQTLAAKYMTAGMNKADITSRQDDNPDDNTPSASENQDEDEAVAAVWDIANKAMGVTVPKAGGAS